MTEQQFEARWKHNQEQRRAESAGIVGKWDQADALLLLESGWTQERIAGKVGKSKSWADYYLRFARFLDSHHGGNSHQQAPTPSIPSTLTERAFRDAWSKTSKRNAEGKKHSEEERFEHVREILETTYRLDPLGMEPYRKKMGTGKIIADCFADGEWRTKEQMLADLETHGVDEKRFSGAFNDMRTANRFDCMVDQKRVKGQDLIRIRKLTVKSKVKSEKVIHFYEEFAPLMKAAKELTDRNITTISSQAILHKLVLIERLAKALFEELDNE